MAEELNGASVAIVKITHRDLVDIAQKMKKPEEEEVNHTLNNNSKQIHIRKSQLKKPVMEIYRPGIGLPKRGNKAEENLGRNLSSPVPLTINESCQQYIDASNHSKEPALLCESSNISNGKSKSPEANSSPNTPQTERRNRTKRPDLQRYIPKPKAALLKEENEKQRMQILNEENHNSLHRCSVERVLSSSTGRNSLPSSEHNELNGDFISKNFSNNQKQDCVSRAQKAPATCRNEMEQEQMPVRDKHKKNPDFTMTEHFSSERRKENLNSSSGKDRSHKFKKKNGKCTSPSSPCWSDPEMRSKQTSDDKREQCGRYHRHNRRYNDAKQLPSSPANSIRLLNNEKRSSVERSSPAYVEHEDWDMEISTSNTMFKAVSQEDVSKVKKDEYGNNEGENWEEDCFSDELGQNSSKFPESKAVSDLALKMSSMKKLNEFEDIEGSRVREKENWDRVNIPPIVDTNKIVYKNDPSCTDALRRDSTISDNEQKDDLSEKNKNEKKAKEKLSFNWSDEVERELKDERAEKQQNVRFQRRSRNIVETSDVESPESPQPITRKKKSSRRTRHHRRRSESSTDEKSSCRSTKIKLSNSSDTISSVQKGGILRIPRPKSPSCNHEGRPVIQSETSRDGAQRPNMIQRHLFDPNNPTNPQVIYKSGGPSHNEAGHHSHDSHPYQEGIEMQSRVPPNPSYPCSHKPPMMCPPLYPMHGFMYPPYPGAHLSEGLFYPMHQHVPPNPVEIQGPSYSKLTSAQRNIREAMALENELNYQLAKLFDIIDQKKLSQCRWKIQLRYENAILSDVEFCTKNNIEQALWKAAFYQVIETFRKQMIDQPNLKDEIRKSLLSLIEEGVIFYENLLEKLQETYGFTLSAFLDSDALRPHSLPRQVKMALISAQKMIICLGDLARYREQANETSNYGKARSWYLKAQQIAPKNGRPYNQLAILALYARRKLDAVYYYMRSLAASNPFHTARESLISLFDEARKKYEQVEKKRSEERALKLKSCNRDSPLKSQEGRQEIWVLPNGTSSEPKPNNSEVNNASDEELNKLSTVDLNKKFILSFLHTHGKLFTKIGMETFVETSTQMLREFRCLLKQTPIPVSGSRLLQLMAINMFTIHHTELKDTRLEPNCRSLLQEHALQISLEMFGILVNRCLTLLKEHTGSDQYPANLLSDDLHHLIPPAKVWCDWLMCHTSIWNPPPVQTDYRNSGEGDAWSQFAELVSTTKAMKTGNIQFLKEPKEGWEPVLLTEDTTLAGFVPLLALPQEMNFASPTVTCDKELVRNVLRLQRLQFCADYLCGIVPPVLYYNVQQKAYFSFINDNSSDSSDAEHGEQIPSKECSITTGEESGADESDQADELDNQRNDSSAIQQLRSRKEELRRKKAHQEKQKQQIQAVLHETRSSCTVLEIQPHYLIPDTNCFIDHLSDIKTLVATNQFQLTVPLVVVNELDGLAKGARPNATDATFLATHNQHVTQGAKEALEYLDSVFLARNPHVRASTAQGSELDTIAFRSEDMVDNVGTNDDLILHCCLRYCGEKHGGRSCLDKDGVTKMYRRLVLLTDDRNLRLKAHSHNVPARDIPSFMSLLHVS